MHACAAAVEFDFAWHSTFAGVVLAVCLQRKPIERNEFGLLVGSVCVGREGAVRTWPACACALCCKATG
jgi:hypothetical protein